MKLPLSHDKVKIPSHRNVSLFLVERMAGTVLGLFRQSRECNGGTSTGCDMWPGVVRLFRTGHRKFCRGRYGARDRGGNEGIEISRRREVLFFLMIEAGESAIWRAICGSKLLSDVRPAKEVFGAMAEASPT